MKKHFRDLLKYNAWANYRMLVTLEENEVKDDKMLLMYSHILSAQYIWLNRIKGLPTSPFPVWEQYKLRELRTMSEETDTNWDSYLEDYSMEAFEEMIFYTDSKGRKHENTIREIIGHMTHHASYHRGQLAIMMREHGITPPPTDYILYCREK